MRNHLAALAATALSLGASAQTATHEFVKPQIYTAPSDIVRTLPYEAIDKDVFEDWYTVRSWILKNEGYCEVKDRHVFVELDGTFAGYISDVPDSLASSEANLKYKNMQKIISTRENWQKEKKHGIVRGSRASTGYPFAYSCDYDGFHEGIGRINGDSLDYLLHGSWKGITIPKDSALSIVETVHLVNDERDYNLPEDVLKRLFGQLLIESAGQQYLRSRAGAKGMLQLKPIVLSNECGIPAKYHYHRIAQIDCALDYLSTAKHYMQTRIERALTNIDEEQQQDLVNWMTTQAYHAGKYRIGKLFGSTEMGDATTYINEHAEEFTDYSGKDLALFIIGHNLGRGRIGDKVLTYGVDTEIAGDAIYQLK